MFGNANDTAIRKLYFLGVILNTFLQTFLYCLAGQILTTQVSKNIIDVQCWIDF